MPVRMDRINSRIQRVLMEIIQREIDDPALGIFSVTRVETTKDLSESRVYYSLLNDTNYEKVGEILKKMSGFIRCSMAKEIDLRIVPQLKFFPDDSIKYSVDIYKKIEEVRSAETKQHTKPEER